MNCEGNNAGATRSMKRTGTFVGARRAAGLLLLALFLGLQLFAASHSLHKQLHADAGHQDHQCAVTALTSGQIDCAPAAVTAPAPVATVEARQIFSESHLALTPSRLLAGRAPPALA